MTRPTNNTVDTALQAEQSLRAPAKINLWLAVCGRRTDGYHEIDTVFLPLPDLFDSVAINQSNHPGLTVSCDHPQVPEDEGNLGHRAALAWARANNIEPAWHIKLTKRIPVAAGLGGGSSDAAAVLQLLNRQADQPLNQSALLEVARGLGADVPFFLCPRPSLGQGVGDRLTPVPLNCDLPLILLNPGGLPLSAATAYATVGNRFERASAPPLLAAMQAGNLAGIARHTGNRFTAGVAEKVPLVAIFLDFLTNSGCLAARLSGSGPTVYGICRDLQQAATIATAARRRFGRAAWTWSGRTMKDDAS